MMKRESKTTYTLNETELLEAVRDWLAKKSEPVSDVSYLSAELSSVFDVVLVDHQVITDSPKS